MFAADPRWGVTRYQSSAADRRAAPPRHSRNRAPSGKVHRWGTQADGGLAETEVFGRARRALATASCSARCLIFGEMLQDVVGARSSPSAKHRHGDLTSMSTVSVRGAGCHHTEQLLLLPTLLHDGLNWFRLGSTRRVDIGAPEPLNRCRAAPGWDACHRSESEHPCALFDPSFHSGSARYRQRWPAIDAASAVTSTVLLKTGIRAISRRGEHEIAVMAAVGAAKITALNAIWARRSAYASRRQQRPNGLESEPACGQSDRHRRAPSARGDHPRIVRPLNTPSR